jgi:hypothetical protein
MSQAATIFRFCFVSSAAAFHRRPRPYSAGCAGSGCMGARLGIRMTRLRAFSSVR